MKEWRERGEREREREREKREREKRATVAPVNIAVASELHKSPGLRTACLCRGRFVTVITTLPCVCCCYRCCVCV